MSESGNVVQLLIDSKSQSVQWILLITTFSLFAPFLLLRTSTAPLRIKRNLCQRCQNIKMLFIPLTHKKNVLVLFLFSYHLYRKEILSEFPLPNLSNQGIRTFKIWSNSYKQGIPLIKFQGLRSLDLVDLVEEIRRISFSICIKLKNSVDRKIVH